MENSRYIADTITIGTREGVRLQKNGPPFTAKEKISRIERFESINQSMQICKVSK